MFRDCQFSTVSSFDTIESRKYCWLEHSIYFNREADIIEKNLIDIKRLSVLAITALLITGVSVTGVAGTKPAPATTSLPNTSLTVLITSLINSVGDDTFSTIDLTTLLATYTSITPTPLHTTTTASFASVDSSSSGMSTTHYGPYASGSSDSGTCGNNWADDTYNRHFTVFQNKDDGSLLVVEQFKDGNFVTPSTDPSQPDTNQSPGACNTAPPPTGNGGTVAAGIQGNFHGYFVIPLPGETQASFSPFCDATLGTNTNCTTTTFINTHFTPACYPSLCSVTTFFFHYSAGDQQLISHEWQNASADRGGNSGDIRSA